MKQLILNFISFFKRDELKKVLNRSIIDKSVLNQSERDIKNTNKDVKNIKSNIDRIALSKINDTTNRNIFDNYNKRLF